MSGFYIGVFAAEAVGGDEVVVVGSAEAGIGVPFDVGVAVIHGTYNVALVVELGDVDMPVLIHATLISGWAMEVTEVTQAATLTPWLHMRHTIFGEVVEGYDVVEKIENTETGFMDKPVKEQKILSISILKE